MNENMKEDEWFKKWRAEPFEKPVYDLHCRVREIEKRLLILEPNFELHDKYPSLKEAYEQYKLIERLITNEQT